MATAQAQTFVYKGKDKKGKATQGEIKGTNLMLVKAQLRKQGCYNLLCKKEIQAPIWWL